MHHTIEVHNLSFAYPGGPPVLRDVSFIIAPGEKVALIGPNGAGKSTLILHLNGILRGAGSVQVAHLEIGDSNLGQVRAAVGLVFQDPDDQLFSPTVGEDVAFGPLHMGYPAGEVRERVAQALSAVGLSGFEKRLSHHLSGGEKKRVAIATVLSMDPEILVLDEPSPGLAPRSRRKLIRLLLELPQTMLISTHDLALVAEVCPRTLVLDGGRLLGDGATQDILGDAALMAEHGLEP
jgi:cobalt/nickel transport system ATP-binding protein